MGFVEETGAAQFLRDVRVTPIYEGTNAIQALDLVGRKLSDGGTAAHALLAELATDVADAEPDVPDLAVPVASALRELQQATDWMLGHDMGRRAGAAVDYLNAMARGIGAVMHLKAAHKGDADRHALAQVYIGHVLPQMGAHLAAMQADPAACDALSSEALGA
jgi:hypothetical protein